MNARITFQNGVLFIEPSTLAKIQMENSSLVKELSIEREARLSLEEKVNKLMTMLGVSDSEIQ